MGKKKLKPATTTQNQFKGFRAFVAGQNFYLIGFWQEDFIPKETSTEFRV